MGIFSSRQQREKIADYEDRLRKAAATIERQGNDILRLRRELQKRTDQYNELVDLAREKGII